MSQLRALGFPIEMDDFGSGYSSLNMLGQMKLDILKLDMKFVQNEIAKSADQSILGDIIAMAHRMRLDVVAEGVETREQVSRLTAVGCDYVQGYYFASPMPIPELEDLWCSQRCPSQAAPAGKETGALALLVVDETPSYRARVRAAFAGQYDVLSAATVEEAFACLQERRQIAAIILSMTLPDDGAARLLKSLRQELALWHIPVMASIPSGEAVEALPAAMETDDFLCKCHPMFDLRRRVDRLVEVVQAHKRERELQDEASQDYLTGLLNRRGLQTAMKALRREDLPLAVYLFDLDDLKKTNDTFGHEMGDQLIQTFASLLRRQTRAGDILCRYGGDEFVAVLRHLGESGDAMKKGQKICDAFCESLETGSLAPACSAGIALCGVDEWPSAELIERADQAVYRAKRDNKGGCCLWEGSAEGNTAE